MIGREKQNNLQLTTIELAENVLLPIKETQSLW